MLGTVMVSAHSNAIKRDELLKAEDQSFTEQIRAVMAGTSQLVSCIDTRLAEAIHALASSSTQGTWQRVVSDLIHSVTFNIGAGWLKSHVGVTDNELADAVAKYTVYACRVLPSHLQPPRMHTVTFDGQPSIQNFRGAARKRLYPEHDHTGIAKSVSFDWPNNYSWFSSFADKWSLGIKGMAGSSPFWDLSDRQCPVCTKQHPLDLISSVAFCSDMSSFLERMAYSWGSVLAPIAWQWVQGQHTKGELRNFARTLVPLSLYKLMTESRSRKEAMYAAVKPRRSCLTSIVKSACEYRRSHPIPDPVPPALTDNTFFQSHGPYSTTDPPPPRNRSTFTSRPLPCPCTLNRSPNFVKNANAHLLINCRQVNSQDL